MIEVCNIISYVLYTQILKQSVLKPASPGITLRYFVPQVPITGKMLNGNRMFSAQNIVQNVKLIDLWGKKLVPLHFVISKI